MKTNLVKESISFERGLNPKDVLKIGDYQTTFKTYEEFMDALIRRLPKILGTPTIPEDIINDPDVYIRMKYFIIIDNYLKENNVNIEDEKLFHYRWNIDLNKKLKEMGF
jgi:hypothetical protein